MLAGGYLGKALRVNLSTGKIHEEALAECDLQRFLGGRGLGARCYYEEIGPQVDALGPDNKVFFFTGPLTGVPLPSTTKFQLATKSAETGLYLCSNSSGDFGPQLKACGYDGLIIEGQAPEWAYLAIADDQVSVGDARPLCGLTTNLARQALLDILGGKGAAALAVGPAAERLVRFSYVNVDERAFGRGGAGAVLASKRLKGIVVRGHGHIPVADEERVVQICRQAIATLRQTRANHTKYGTAQYIEVINELGCMPTRNFQTSQFESAGGVDAHALLASYQPKNFACYRCPVGCGKVAEVAEGPFAGARARPEYETIGMFGPSCGVDDLAAVVAANEACDELGMDTISTANAVALAMELFERGLITAADTGGLELSFGDGDAMVEMVRMIGERRAIGDALAEGMAGFVRQRPEATPYVVAVKGLPFPAYDPRGFHGMGLALGTSSRGACHNVGGWTIRDELQSGKYDRFALQDKAALVKGLQDTRAYLDSLGICTVVRGSLGFTAQPQGDVMEAVTGCDVTSELMEIGARIYSLERLILNREGVRRVDDLLPPRITGEAVASGPAQGHVLSDEMYAVMLDDYYGLRGWDADGVVTVETRHELGLD